MPTLVILSRDSPHLHGWRNSYRKEKMRRHGTRPRSCSGGRAAVQSWNAEQDSRRGRPPDTAEESDVSPVNRPSGAHARRDAEKRKEASPKRQSDDEMA